MIQSHDTKEIEFGGPATYRIVVKGELGDTWSDRLAGMAISVMKAETGSPHTTLFGPLRDQAQLNGVLETLYGLHLPILRVEKVDEDAIDALAHVNETNTPRKGGEQ
jgi:hypothetical protein